MRSEHALRAIAVAAALLGAVTIAGNLLTEDIAPSLRFTSALAGSLLVWGGWLLTSRPNAGVLLLWLSAVVYFVSIIYPGIQRHGPGVFDNLIASFYWSMGLRIGLAALAQVVVKFVQTPLAKT